MEGDKEHILKDEDSNGGRGFECSVGSFVIGTGEQNRSCVPSQSRAWCLSATHARAASSVVT